MTDVPVGVIVSSSGDGRVQRAGDRREAVDHPDHYGGADNPYEAVKVIEAWGLPWHLGDAVKYIARHGKKDPAKLIEDLKKARWYIDRYIKFLESK